MEESYDPIIKVVYMPFFEAEITKRVRWGKSHITHVFCVYRICQITCFFYPRRNMQDFCQYEILPPIHLYLGCLIPLTSLWHGRQWFCYNVNINNTVQLAETKG